MWACPDGQWLKSNNGGRVCDKNKEAFPLCPIR